MYTKIITGEAVRLYMDKTLFHMSQKEHISWAAVKPITKSSSIEHNDFVHRKIQLNASLLPDGYNKCPKQLHSTELTILVHPCISCLQHYAKNN